MFPFISLTHIHTMLQFPTFFLSSSSQVQVPDPVDEIEEAKCGGKEYSGIGVNFRDVHMHPVLAPRSGATVVKTAEETGAVLPIQTFVGKVIIVMVWDNVVHLQ